MNSNEKQENSPHYQMLEMLTTQTLSVMTAQLPAGHPVTEVTIEYISNIVHTRDQVLDYILKLTMMRGDDPFSAQYKKVEANFKEFLSYFPKETKQDDARDED